jgi:hypothetical protein
MTALQGANPIRLQRVIRSYQPWAAWAPERLLDPFHESGKSERY